jgi:protein tyrosine phosphatase (PTP) superfamily phosphohydrolase (DUF442 family)
MVMHARLRISSSLVFAVLIGCQSPPSDHGATTTIGAAPPVMAETSPVDRPGLHNLVAYHDDFISGGAPEGDDGFESLAAMGVVTIISVDGAVPEVERATARGMRYIHLPIGYDGFDDDRRLELTRAVRDAIESGPVYLHCHHGKHRSAGAAAAVAVGLDWMTPDEATARMKVSGTSPRYRGLYLCTANATPVDARTLDAINADFPEISTPDDFVDAMVEMDHALDHLKCIAATGWMTPESHPDLVPAAEAGRLADLLRLASQGERAASEPNPDFAAWLARDAVRVATLEERLLAESIDVATLDAEFAAIRSSCSACHAAHRD